MKYVYVYNSILHYLKHADYWVRHIMKNGSTNNDKQRDLLSYKN